MKKSRKVEAEAVTAGEIKNDEVSYPRKARRSNVAPTRSSVRLPVRDEMIDIEEAASRLVSGGTIPAFISWAKGFVRRTLPEWKIVLDLFLGRRIHGHRRKIKG